ncbi:hypothetical protein C8R44DRAFT_304177 [Mycena epipterygia]|nr:hypothetical protein C8R44DRAFT_304177 [Mycena epipterygia]
MTRRTFFVVCLATFTIVCQAAPLNGGTSQKASSTSAGPKAHSPSGTKSFNPRSTPRPSPTSSKIRPLSSAVSSKIPSTPFPSTVTAPSETKSTLLSSATQQYTTSAPILPTPTLPAAPNWVMYANGTTGYALSLLLSSIGADAGQRWVTAEIASTQIGSTDPAGSNKDLSSAVDTLVGEPSTHQTWVDTYIDFLIEAGGDINSTAETQVKNHGNNVTATWAVEQTKLVKAYAAAHPGNVTYVGVNVTGVQTLDAITSGEIIGWAWHGGDTNCTSSTAANSTSISMNNATSTSGGAANCTLDSDGPYTTKDYQAYSNATAAYETLQTEIAGFGDLTQVNS